MQAQLGWCELGKSYPEIDGNLATFIERQRMFFVATVPSDAAGHINLSPKGLDTFRILGPKSVAFVDLVGSGIETIAHVKNDGRIVLMFCAFEGPPSVLRLHGRARVMESGAQEFEELAIQFPTYEFARSIIVVDVIRISTSCGFGVPLMKFEGDRSQLAAWAKKKGPEGLRLYKDEKNRRSLDGLPGLSE